MTNIQSGGLATWRKCTEFSEKACKREKVDVRGMACVLVKLGVERQGDDYKFTTGKTNAGCPYSSSSRIGGSMSLLSLGVLVMYR
jgi:hypothetical protein